MSRLILTRLLTLIPLMFLVTSIVFFMVRFVPGDPFAELYRLKLEGPGGQSTIETGVPELSCAVSAMPGQAGDIVKLSVVTIGPSAVSHAISTNFML